MMGGIIWPPVEAAASTPPAKRPRKPLDFISGMVITPVEAVFAMAEPLIVPVKAEEITATKPAPPRTRPATTLETSMTKSLAPEATRNPPNTMKRVILDEDIKAKMPNIPSSLYSERKSTSLSGKLAARKTPGRCSPKNRIYARESRIRIGMTHPETRRERSIAANSRKSPAIQSPKLNCHDWPVTESVSS